MQVDLLLSRAAYVMIGAFAAVAGWEAVHALTVAAQDWARHIDQAAQLVGN